jgi:hypothetical protein
MPLRFYTSEKLGVTQSVTPDGFLLCENVPIARTGTLLYSDMDGIPIDGDQDGIIRVYRDQDEVFAPIAIASFAGKPVTNEHPPEKVSPGNWKEYSVGVVLNPRRGDGTMFDNDFLFCDLLIQDADAITDVRAGKREVSAGYDAEYEQIRPGEGRQHLIIGNHVALVERGRCGPRCAIGDSEMAVRRNMPAWADRIMRAARTGDEETLVDTLEKVGDMLGNISDGKGGTNLEGPQRMAPVPGGETRDEIHVHVHGGSSNDDGEGDKPDAGGGSAAVAAPAPAAAAGGGDPAGGGGASLEELSQRVEALERAVAILAQEEGGEEQPEADPNGGGDTPAPGGESEGGGEEDRNSMGDRRTVDRRSVRTGDGQRSMVGDSASMKTAWQALLTNAEFIVPGIRQPTFDARAPAKTTFDAMCNFRRRVLGEGMKEDDSKSVIVSLGDGRTPDLKKMTCDAVALLFNGAAAAMRSANGARATHVQDGMVYRDNQSVVQTVQDMNKRNREFYKVVQ